jgi:hypothetical protein
LLFLLGVWEPRGGEGLVGEKGVLWRETYIQMTACGSLARDVPRRNLRRWSLVSCEKVNSLASEP